MTALPLSNSLAKVRALLPVKIRPQRSTRLLRLVDAIAILDKDGQPFCYVPANPENDMARAKLIRDCMNEMKKGD